ncbi:hypothetical protein [Clostridium formicaceticum]|uniref:Uncharacterized protein n=1 Tax=Clostridium formicaceticum TaxID=1497 RepID=A0AAC9WES6_9CLOT|nr:hypothetical protein [Clostridium formicaceticum]ARE86056.1 hypothetical protein CLFO_03720 [Clostridium formicaceticum]
MARRYRTTSHKRSLAERLGSENIMPDGMLYPVEPTDLAVFQIMRGRYPKNNRRR